MKIAIIGYSGSGKSTFAAWISRKKQIPLLHLDKIHWLPGWKERPEKEERQLIKDFLDSHDSWVIDGNYHSLEYERRMKEADRILFFDFSRFSCLWRAWKRVTRYKGRTRSSMTEGCQEKLDGEFALWILYEGRTRKIREEYQRIMRQYQGKIIRIKNQKELDREKRRWMKH